MSDAPSPSALRRRIEGAGGQLLHDDGTWASYLVSGARVDVPLLGSARDYPRAARECLRELTTILGPMCCLCAAPAVLHLPPWAGSEGLCRVCADRLRAELTPPDEAERRALAAIGDRASRVPAAELALEGRPSGDGMRWELAPRAPRCPCPECSRGGRE